MPNHTAAAAITRYTFIACTSFLVLMVAVCMLLDPGLFDHPHWGLSYYGSQTVTLLPYYLGYVLVIYCLAGITRLLWRLKGQWRFLRIIFLVSAVLTFLVAATSYMDGGAFIWWAHIYVCLALLLWVLGAEVWILTRPGKNWQDYMALVLLLTGVVLAFLSVDWFGGGVLGVYYWGEVVMFLGAFTCFGLAALRAVKE